MNKDTYNLILLNAGHAVHYANWNYEKIRSSFARIYYVTKGMATVKLETGTHILQPDYLYLLPSFTTHTDECSGEFALYYLHVYDISNNTTSLFERFNFPFEIKAISVDRVLIERLLTINPNIELKKYDPKLYDNTPTLLDSISSRVSVPIAETFETQGILQQLLSRFLKTATPKFVATDKRILISLEYITSHIEDELNIRKLANICSLSLDHFIRLFRKEMNKTPLVYINEKRIERAQSLLIFTNQPVKDIAYQLSFENVSYFNRLFKKYTGYTPLEYRMKA
jgi:AraC-like DNA-binding protein